MRRTVLHERFVAAGAHFNTSTGWEFVEWFEGERPVQLQPGFGRPASFGLVADEHRAVRERVGIMDMTLMAKFVVQGRDAAAVLSRALRQRRGSRGRPGGLHPVAAPERGHRCGPHGDPARPEEISRRSAPTSSSAAWSRWSTRPRAPTSTARYRRHIGHDAPLCPGAGLPRAPRPTFVGQSW